MNRSKAPTTDNTSTNRFNSLSSLPWLDVHTDTFLLGSVRNTGGAVASVVEAVLECSVVGGRNVGSETLTGGGDNAE